MSHEFDEVIGAPLIFFEYLPAVSLPEADSEYYLNLHIHSKCRNGTDLSFLENCEVSFSKLLGHLPFLVMPSDKSCNAT